MVLKTVSPKDKYKDDDIYQSIVMEVGGVHYHMDV